MKMFNPFAAFLTATLLFLAGCASGPQRGDPPMELAPFVDLERFMGLWYVQGYTPTPLDPNAFNPTEEYELMDDGRIQTTYRFRADDPAGEEKVFRPVARVFDTESNAEWRMRFFGVINTPYLILFVSDDYTETVIGHPDRDLAWIMTRDVEVSEARYAALRDELKSRDFDLSEFVRAVHGEAE
jgi:apolipoprotein D and lipocalin family protein